MTEVWFPWNGSKNRLAEDLTSVLGRWPARGRWIEPFVGGGSISQLVRRLFPAVPQLVSDANPWLSAAYEWQCLSEPYHVPENFLDVGYWRSRTDEDLPALTVADRATRFAICLHTAWGNRWETRPDGAFRSTVNRSYCQPAHLRGKLESFFSRRWLTSSDAVRCCDWKEAVKDVQPGDLVYLDPPYPESLGYGNQTWRLSDLLDVVDWITASSCSVILSNVSDIKRLLERTGFEIKIVPGPKATQTRRPRTEMIAHRFEKGSL